MTTDRPPPNILSFSGYIFTFRGEVRLTIPRNLHPQVGQLQHSMTPPDSAQEVPGELRGRWVWSIAKGTLWQILPLGKTFRTSLPIESFVNYYKDYTEKVAEKRFKDDDFQVFREQSRAEKWTEGVCTVGDNTGPHLCFLFLRMQTK